MTEKSTRPLSLAPERLPDPVRTIARELERHGERAWLVGGCVRDSLLAQLEGRSPPGAWVTKDWDLATSAEPERVMRIFHRVVPTGIEHGTVTVMIGRTGYEVTTLRADASYSDGRRPDRVAFVRSIEDDLARRDFTVNAIAVEPLTGAIIDPFGGVRDLERRLLRAVGEPARRFAEDGLRVLRAARFVASLGFELDPATEAAIRPSLDTYRKVSPERVREEWVKTLASPAPSRGFRIMAAQGLLSVTAPELERLVRAGTDAAGAFRHTLGRVDRAPVVLEIRLAALFGDVERAAPGDTQAVYDLLTRLRFSNAERKRVTDLLRHFPVDASAGESDVAMRRWLRRVGPDLYRDLCRLQRAELEAMEPPPSGALERLQALEQRAAAVLAAEPPLSLGQLALNGRTLMARLGVAPGPRIGEVLNELLALVVDDPSANREELLLERARERLGLGDAS